MTQTTWEQQSGTTKAADGISLYYEAWVPAQPRALILLAHGMWEHMGRYGHVVARLAGEGFAVFAMDHRGHGRSGGPRGHVDRFDRYLDDFQRLQQMAVSKMGQNLPVIALGHSFGGLLVLRYAIGHQDTLRGVVASAPALLMAWEPPLWKQFVGKALSNIIPTMTLPNELDATMLSRDPNIVNSYKSDPLVHDLISTRAYTEISNAMGSTLGDATKLRIPFLIVHGDDDRLNSLEGSRQFYERSTITDKKLLVMPGVRHELFNEPEPDRSRVLDEIVAWLHAHT